MMGLPFFRRVVALCERSTAMGEKSLMRCRRTASRWRMTVGALFAEQHFLIGVLSIDGPASSLLHIGLIALEKGHHERMTAAMARLKTHQHVDFNALLYRRGENITSVVKRTSTNFFWRRDRVFIQFIPLVERMSTDNSSVLNLVMPGGAAKLAPWTVPSWQ